MFEQLRSRSFQEFHCQNLLMVFAEHTFNNCSLLHCFIVGGAILHYCNLRKENSTIYSE